MVRRLRTALAGCLLALVAHAAPAVVAVTIDGVVHPVTSEIVRHAIELARERNAAALLVRLNTPGGLLDATRDIDQQLLACPVPVITFVAPGGARAASAGFFILEAGDVAAMAPGTNTGAASPVLLNQQMDPVMRTKIENDAAALLRSMTANRNRNASVAGSTVLEAKSFTEREALDQHLIDLIAPDEGALLNTLNGREITRFDGRKQTLALAGASIVDYHKTTRETVIAAIADPNVGFVLMTAGALGLYAEFSHPGLMLPGVLGAISLLLGLSSLSVLPVNWAGAALLALAVGLFIAEAKVTSHGILGGAGTLAMVMGAVLLIDAPPPLRIRWLTAISTALPFALITTFLMTLVLRARRNKVLTGSEGLIGVRGEARTAIAPRGTVFVNGAYWNAESDAPVAAGERVSVVAVDGLTLKVRKEQS